MSKVCKVCGWENEDSDKVCAMCNTDLSDVASSNNDRIDVAPSFPNPMEEKEGMTVAQVKTVAQSENPQSKMISNGKRFVVNCENSRTKTIVESANITSFYCEGCKEEHQIDGFFWTVQEEEGLVQAPTSTIVETTIEQVSSGSGQHLVLEDADTHVKIEIGSEGGTLGRYGTFGASYLQSDPRGRMVSGEHCRFKYEYGRWSIEHLSRTNDTVYNGRKLEHGYEEAIRDGKIITLANAISFIVRIF